MEHFVHLFLCLLTEVAERVTFKRPRPTTVTNGLYELNASLNFVAKVDI